VRAVIRLAARQINGSQIRLGELAGRIQRRRFALRQAPQDFRAQQRAQGYAQAMAAAGLTPDVQASSFDDELNAGAQMLERLSREPPDQQPQAVTSPATTWQRSAPSARRSPGASTCPRTSRSPASAMH
jgi:DNA-binding LacI/PurR family transcriptional regulator